MAKATSAIIVLCLVGLAFAQHQSEYLPIEMASTTNWYSSVACDPTDFNTGLNAGDLARVNNPVMSNIVGPGLDKSVVEGLIADMNAHRELAASGALAGFPAARDMAFLERSPELECNSMRWLHVARGMSCFTGLSWCPGMYGYLRKYTKVGDVIESSWNHNINQVRELAAAKWLQTNQLTQARIDSWDGSWNAQGQAFVLWASATKVGCSAIQGDLPYTFADGNTMYFTTVYLECQNAGESRTVTYESLVTGYSIYKHEADTPRCQYPDDIPEHTYQQDASGAYPNLCFTADELGVAPPVDPPAEDPPADDPPADDPPADDPPVDDPPADDLTGRVAATNLQTYLTAETNTDWATGAACDPANLRASWTQQMIDDYNAATGGMTDYTLGLTDAEMESMLQEHNSLRDQAAAGSQAGNGVTLPAAKYMALLRRDPVLECMALRWVDFQAATGKKSTHSYKPDMRQGSYVGENMYWHSAQVSGLGAPDSWYSEIQYMQEPCLIDTQAAECQGYVIGHYTAVVWHSVTRVGCSRAKGSIGTLVVCTYAGEPNQYAPNMYATQAQRDGANGDWFASIALVYPHEDGVTTHDNTWGCNDSLTPGYTDLGYDPAYPNLCGNPAYPLA